jgi:SP family sugar:H+ symporter-like MFS transporter
MSDFNRETLGGGGDEQSSAIPSKELLKTYSCTKTDNTEMSGPNTESQNTIDTSDTYLTQNDNFKGLEKNIEPSGDDKNRISPLTAETGTTENSLNNSNARDAKNPYMRKIENSLSTVISSLKNMKSDRTTQIMNARNQKKRKFKSSFMAVYVGLLTAVGGFLYGYDTGMINSLLEMPYVKAHFTKDGRGYFTSEERALMTAILSLGTIFGSLFSPFVSDRYGRRFCMVWTLILIFNLGIILQIVSESFKLMLAGRFINGFGVGVISSIIPLFQAEVSPRWIRGSVISFYQWAITWGLLISSAISQGTRHMDAASCFQIPVGLQFIWTTALLLGLLSLPESPRFYVMKNDIDGAILSLSRYRRLTIDDEELIEELIEIKASHDYETDGGSISYLDCFRSSKGRAHQLKRMFTCISIQAFQQCSGINFIFYYGVNFFVGTGINESYLMSLITYAVNVVFTIPGILLVDKVGRRKLLIIGAAGMVVSNYVIAIVGVKTNTVIANKVMLAFVCLFIAFFASTWGPVVWVVTGELFSLSVRQKAVSLSATTNWLVNFLFAYLTPYLIDQGTHTTMLGTNIFFMWGSLNLAGLIVTIFFIYETKGLLLEEVDELYRRCSNPFNSAKMNIKISEANSVPNNVEPGISNEPYSFEMNNFTESGNTELGLNKANSKIDRSYTVNEANALTPMDYLNQWEERHQPDNILSDNIVRRIPNDNLPEFLTNSDDDGSSSIGGSDSDSGVSNDSNVDFSFNYALYGDDSHRHTTTTNNNNNNNNNDDDDDDDGGGGDVLYREYLEQFINDVNQRTGINLHPHQN